MSKPAVSLRVSVVDGKANVELVAGDGSTINSSDPSGHLQVVDEGAALVVELSLSAVNVKVFHPDMEFLMTTGQMDRDKLKITVTPPDINFKMHREAVAEEA